MCINKNSDKLPWYEALSAKLEYSPNDGSFVYNDNYNSVARKGKLAGSINSRGYWQIGIRVKGELKMLTAHRLAWFITHGELPNIIDHIDGNKINNAISNLRSCTYLQNVYNTGKKPNNKVVFRGVSRVNKKWRARIRVNGINKHLGMFDTAEEASRVYEEKARELHGEFYNGRI